MRSFFNENILILLLLSGFLAYVGDYLGRRLGKLRVTIPGLRPKTTAIVISIITGMLITVVTLLILTTISEEAKVALFKSREIKAERDAIKVEYERALNVLKDLNESKEKLRAETSSLAKSLEIKKRERVVFQPDELLDFVVISPDSKSTEVDYEKQYLAMIERVRNLSASFGVQTRSTDEIWAQLRTPLMDAASKLRQNQELVVYLKTTQRVMEGEFLEDVKVQAERNRIIYGKGDIISFDGSSGQASETEHVLIDGAKTREHIKVELMAFFDRVREKVKEDGMVIEPFTNFDSITLHDMVNEIKKFNCKIKLSVEITDNVSIIGPFAFRIKFFKI
ncbi:MAG TPA: DUF3084 domain-containing protein [Candidatus Wallbacteria bacterium]|nr:DUF3084 domain-containing protein [Candidatus Wallbacteria bacterium]